MSAVQVAPSGECSQGKGRYGVVCRGNPVSSIPERLELKFHERQVRFTFTFKWLFIKQNMWVQHCVICWLCADRVMCCCMMSGGISILQHLVSNLCRCSPASHWPGQGYQRRPAWYQDHSETRVSHSVACAGSGSCGFLGRLRRVDLIISIRGSDVRPSVHKKFFRFRWNLVCR